jgi:hypothetical protein
MVRTPHPVLLPAQAHRGSIDGQVDVANQGPVLDPGDHTARCAADLGHHLLDRQLDVWPSAFEVQDSDIFEAHEGRQDLDRVSDDVGASALLAHNLKLEAPSSRLR